VTCATALAACSADFNDELYFRWDDRRVQCSQVIDDRNFLVDMHRLADRMDDAVAHGAVYNIYAHIPGQTIDLAMIDRLLAKAERRHLSFVTYRDMLDVSDPRPGLALSFDDDAVDAWLTMRDILKEHHARVTFFVTRYAAMTPEARAGVRQLADDGHDIEAHSVNHLNAPKYVADHGLDAYMKDEALPSIAVLEADGYPVTTFAYPFGARSAELDHALLEHVAMVRATAGTCPAPADR